MFDSFTQPTELSLYEASVYEYDCGCVGDKIASKFFHSLTAAKTFCDMHDAADRRLYVTRLADDEIVYDL